MKTAGTLDIALLVLRLSLAWVFLYAAWRNTENSAAWTWTTNETGLLFANLPADQRQRIARLCAIAGMMMMYGGGISILLGLEPRLGGLLVIVFSVMGLRVHTIRRDEAKKAGEAGNAMGWSAFSAHVAAGLKNWALIGMGAFFVLVGAGRYGVGVDFLGRIFD